MPGLVFAALDVVAECEPLSAFDLAATLAPTQQRTDLWRDVLSRGGAKGDDVARALGDKVLALDASTRDALLPALASSWGLSRPRPATDWLLAHASQVPAASFNAVAQRFGETDPDTAATYLDLVPREAREAWIAAVARGYASTDLEAAQNFVARFRGDPAYDTAAGSLAQALAPYDPPAAARLLGGVNIAAGMNPGAAMMVGRQWAMRDPASAAAWALRLSQRNARLGTVLSVAQIWARGDVEAARAWVLGLPAGENRDTALRGVLTEIVTVDVPDADLIGAFSSEAAKQQILPMTVFGAAITNPDNARRTIETYVTDPEIKAQLLSRIDAAVRVRASMPAGVTLSPPIGPSPAERFPPR